EDRAVDLMKASRERSAEIHEGGDAGSFAHAHRRASSFEAGRHAGNQPGPGRENDAGACATDAHLGKDRIAYRKIGTLDGDAAAFNRAERMNGSKPAGGH